MRCTHNSWRRSEVAPEKRQSVNEAARKAPWECRGYTHGGCLPSAGHPAAFYSLEGSCWLQRGLNRGRSIQSWSHFSIASQCCQTNARVPRPGNFPWRAWEINSIFLFHNGGGVGGEVSRKGGPGRAGHLLIAFCTPVLCCPFYKHHLTYPT